MCSRYLSLPEKAAVMLTKGTPGCSLTFKPFRLPCSWFACRNAELQHLTLIISEAKQTAKSIGVPSKTARKHSRQTHDAQLCIPAQSLQAMQLLLLFMVPI